MSVFNKQIVTSDKTEEAIKKVIEMSNNLTKRLSKDLREMDLNNENVMSCKDLSELKCSFEFYFQKDKNFISTSGNTKCKKLDFISIYSKKID